MQIPCKSDANPMHIMMSSPHSFWKRVADCVLPLCYRPSLGSLMTPFQKPKRKMKRKRKRNLRLEKVLLPTRSSLIQAGSSGRKSFAHPRGGKELWICIVMYMGFASDLHPIRGICVLGEVLNPGETTTLTGFTSPHFHLL